MSEIEELKKTIENKLRKLQAENDSFSSKIPSQKQRAISIMDLSSQDIQNDLESYQAQYVLLDRGKQISHKTYYLNLTSKLMQLKNFVDVRKNELKSSIGISTNKKIVEKDFKEMTRKNKFL